MHINIMINAIRVNTAPSSDSLPNVPTQNRYIQHIIKSINPLWFHIISAYFIAISISFWSIFDIFTLSPP